MNHRYRITRRAFLQQSVSAALAGLAFSFPFITTTRAVSAARPGAKEAWIALLRDHESAAVVGRAYLRLASHERNAAKLVTSIEEGSHFGGRFDTASARARREWLDQRVRLDFAIGNTVQLEGWILARTEARLCALAAVASRIV